MLFATLLTTAATAINWATVGSILTTVGVGLLPAAPFIDEIIDQNL